MDFALQAALMGAVLGSAILAAATIYGWSQPAAPNAYGWWAAAFVLETASKGILTVGTTPLLIEVSDSLHGLSACLAMCGAVTILGRRVTPELLGGGLLAALAWAVVAHLTRNLLHLSALPLFGIGGIPLLMGAWGFVLRGRTQKRHGTARLAAATFTASGLHQLAAPLLHTQTTLATWSFVTAQLLSMAMAVALLLVVLQRQQTLAEIEGRRANLLQSRLLDALGSVQDAVALFDGNDRLVTCNALYREFLSPIAEILKPGRRFEDIARAELETGVIAVEPKRRAEWLADVMRRGNVGSSDDRHFHLWNGRWISLNVYGTADGGHLRILRDISASKQAETLLQESLTWLRGVMDTVVDGIVALDDTATILSFNPAASRIFGYDANAVVGRNATLLLQPPAGENLAQLLPRMVTRGETSPVSFQIQGQRKDGTLFPLDVAVTEMHQGDMIAFICVLRDITDRKRVEDALVESEQRFRDLAESASDWFWETDADLRITFVSSRVRQVLEIGPSNFIGRSFLDLIPSGDVFDWGDRKDIIRAHHPFRGLLFPHRLASGEVKYVELAGRPAFDSSGTFRGFRGTATDITPLKHHEHELAAQSAQRQAIIDNMGSGIVVFDADERLIAMNHPARQMLAPGEAEPALDTLERVLLHLARHGEFGHGDAKTQVLRRLVHLRHTPNQVFEHARPSGGVLEVRTSAMPGGSLIFTVTDITDRKKVEDTLRQAKEEAERGNRSKASFLANISHELRTPLNAIIGFSELMEHEIFGPLEPASYRGYVNDIHESGMHLLELINDILDMSKAEAGMTDLEETVVDVATLVHSSMRMMSRRAASHGITLEERIPDSLPFLRADERRLRQIMLNLVSNAVKFTDNGGCVTVSAAMDATGMVLTVADNGIGMTPEDLARVMEPFVQADSRLSRKYEGTGLGLPLARALVQAHGGSITLSSAPEQGTTARVTFPLERVVPQMGDPNGHPGETG